MSFAEFACPVGMRDNEIVLNKLFEYKGELVKTDNQLQNTEKLYKAGENL